MRLILPTSRVLIRSPKCLYVNWRAWSPKMFTVQFPQFSIYFISPSFIHSPQCSLLQQPQIAFLSYSDRPDFTPTQGHPANRFECQILLLKPLLSYLSSSQLKSVYEQCSFSTFFSDPLAKWYVITTVVHIISLTLILLTWRIWWAPNDASRWQMLFNSAFKVLNVNISTTRLLQHWPLGLEYTGCNRRNVRDFGRVFLMLNYTDITQNNYIQSWTVTEIMAGEVWNFDSCYSLIDYKIHIETGRNMWFL